MIMRYLKRYSLLVIAITCVNILGCYLFIRYNNFSRINKTGNNDSMHVGNRLEISKVEKSKNDARQICVNKNKYVRYECTRPLCGGWADRLRGLMSAYIWSIFTKREFLIDVQYPCLLTNMLEPNRVQWNKTVKCYDDNLSDDLKYSTFSSIRLDKVSNRDFYALLRSIDIDEYYKETNLIIVRNNLDWIYSFSFNKNVHKYIKEFGSKPETFKLTYFFRRLYNNLFKLSPHLQKKYDYFLKQAKPSIDYALICAQVRIGGARPGVAYDLEFTSRNNSKLFWQFIRDKFIKEHNLKKYKLFITTDTEEIEKECIKEFGIKNVVYNEGPFTHIDREPLNKHDCSSVDKVILDFHSLQNCDYAVISQSGFGRLGVANRQDPLKNLYRFETHTDKKHHNKSYVFKKIEDINIL